MSLSFRIKLYMNNGDIVIPGIENHFECLFNSRGPAMAIKDKLREMPNCIYNDKIHAPTVLYIHNNVENATLYILKDALKDYNVDEILHKLFSQTPNDISPKWKMDVGISTEKYD